MGIEELDRWQHLRNDIIGIWMDSPGLTVYETIDLLRKQGLIERPQYGIIDTLTIMKEEFDARPTRSKDRFDNLDTNDSPVGSNPYMEG